jgi:hypothetical protein
VLVVIHSFENVRSKLFLARVTNLRERHGVGGLQSVDPVLGRASRASATSKGKDDGRNTLETELHQRLL